MTVKRQTHTDALLATCDQCKTATNVSSADAELARSQLGRRGWRVKPTKRKVLDLCPACAGPEQLTFEFKEE